MAKFKYNAGDIIGPYNIKMIERTYKKKNRWYGIFECPHCHNTFKAALTDVQIGDVQSCGCLVNSSKEWNCRFKYHIGDEVGPYHIILLERLYKDSKRKWVGLFQCHCGKEFTARVESVASGNTTSCGCNNSKQCRELGYSNAKDITGQRFGKLVAICPTDKRVGSNIVWKLQCDCGKYTFADTGNLLAGYVSSCGCLISKGENKIADILSKQNISHQRQHCFQYCVNPKTNSPLRFDFYLPDYNCCIEYDGIQHFQEVDYFGSSLTDNQYRDSIKNQYCINNNIGLIRIPYWDYDKIDKQYLNNLLLKNSPLYLIHYLDTSNFQYLDNNFNSGIEIIPDSYKRIISI